MHHAPRVLTAGTAPEVQCDGLAALAVASAILTGVVARDNGRPLHKVHTSMLATATHVLADWVVDYENAPEAMVPAYGGRGLSALYRMYDASEGRIFLAAPQHKEWLLLVEALREFADFADDERFSTPDGRTAGRRATRRTSRLGVQQGAGRLLGKAPRCGGRRMRGTP